MIFFLHPDMPCPDPWPWGEMAAFGVLMALVMAVLLPVVGYWTLQAMLRVHDRFTGRED